MTDYQMLLERVAAANPVPDPGTLPEATISMEDVRTYVMHADDEPMRTMPEPNGMLHDTTLGHTESTWRRGRWIAAAAFIAVLALGIVFLFTRADTQEFVEPPPSSTVVPTTVPATTTPPTTVTPTTVANLDDAAPLSDATATTIEAFVEALNDRDAAAAAAVVGAGAGDALIASLDTADQFEDDYEIDACGESDGIVQCRVLYEDRFSDHLDLEPSEQLWTMELLNGSIIRLDVTMENPERTEAITEFEAFVADREGAAPAFSSDSPNFDRSNVVLAAFDTHLVEFGALRSGIPPATWALVLTYFESLSAGDIETFLSVTTDDASFSERSRFGGQDLTYTRPDPLFESHFASDHVWLQMDIAPLNCTGDETKVSCRVRKTGALTLDTDGFEDGVHTLDFDGDQITFVNDLFNPPLLGGFCDNFWFTDGPPNAGDIWACGGSDLPETEPISRALLEWYPRYLASTGVDVPEEYLDGSLLP